MKFLSDLGVQTCQDVRTVWRNGQLLVEEFETDHGRLPADQAFSIAMMHTLACRRGQDALRRGVGELVDERTSTERGRPVITLSGVPEPAHPPRQVIREGFTGGPPVLVELAARDPHAREVATKQAKLDAMFQLMMEDFVDPEEIGLSPEELTDPLKFQQFKDSLLVAPTRLGVQRLSTLVSSLRRWKRWALELPCSVRSPTPFNVAMFLRQVSRGGPTAAASMWHVMAWYATKMGLQFPTTHFLVHPFRMHELTHSGVQACELAPWELVNLVMMASHAQGSYRLVLAFMIQSAVSCIRYEHMQRSSLVRCGPDYLEFRCSQGKARRQGARPAYSWVTPEVSWQGWSLISTLRDFYTNELLPNCGFLWPALRLTSEDLWEITDMTPFAVNRAMSRARFLELLRGALLEMKVEQSAAQTAGYNRLRRFLPTLGNVLALDRDSMQAVGSWVEIPAVYGPQPSKGFRASNPMSLHYSGQKMLRSAQVKNALMKRFFQLFRIKRPELALSVNNLLRTDAWGWEELAALNASGKLAAFEIAEPATPPPLEDQAVVVVEEGALVEIDAEDLPQQDAKAEEVPVEDDDGSGSGITSLSDSSPSASDHSADGEDLLAVMPEEQVGLSLPWFVQGARTHIVKATNESHELIPWCRDRPYLQECKSRGEGFSEVAKQMVCQRCLSRMPRSIYASLAEHCQWMH